MFGGTEHRGGVERSGGVGRGRDGDVVWERGLTMIATVRLVAGVWMVGPGFALFEPTRGVRDRSPPREILRCPGLRTGIGGVDDRTLESRSGGFNHKTR